MQSLDSLIKDGESQTNTSTSDTPTHTLSEIPEKTPNDFDSWSDYDEYMVSQFPDEKPVEDSYGDLTGKEGVN